VSDSLTIPRGTPGQPAIALNMGEVYTAERRLNEVSLATPDTAPMLMGYFNEVCNTTTKYLSWVEYEILMAQKNHELAKATVILERSVEEFKKLKDTGIKYNEDFRNAVVARDPDCQSTLDTLNALMAVRALLDSKARTFVRAYNATRSLAERRSLNAAMPNLNFREGDTYTQPFTAPAAPAQDDFIGTTNFGGRKSY
jgi:hypothetical protein